MHPFEKRLTLVIIAAVLGVGGTPAEARILRAASGADLQSQTGRLVAGDTLLVAAGNYDVSTWNIAGLSGTANAWIVIRADGKAVIRGTSGCCNLVQMSNVSYVKLAGFEITMRDTFSGIDGVNLRGSRNHYIEFDSLYIHDMTNVGIGMWPDSADHITLRNTQICNNYGSGLYWGYPGRNIIHDVLIENNYIHHCPKDPLLDTHYGIQWKGWCYRAIIRNNVLHDVGGTTRCGIVVYYGRKPLAGDDPADINIVRGNILWNCRNEGITAMSDALIENNIVFDAGVGINLQTYGDESFTGSNAVEHLTVRNNTVFRCRSACMAISGWSSAGAQVSVTGNALYQDAAGKTAVSGSIGAAIARANIVFGASSLGQGAAAGRGLNDFASVNATAAVPALDFYPSSGSSLVNCSTDATIFALQDFNQTARPQGNGYDAGAYERTAEGNPGWAVIEGFKSSGASNPGSVRLALRGPAKPASASSLCVVVSPARPRDHLDAMGRTINAATIPSAAGIEISHHARTAAGDLK